MPIEPYPNVSVLVLSTIEQEANVALLGGAGFQVVVLGSRAELDSWLASSADVCAFLVDRSFLAMLSSCEQRSLIERLASYSTFPWIRLDGSVRELLLTYEEISKIMGDCRCRSTAPTHHEMTVAQTSIVHESELEHIHRAARLLSVDAGGLVQLGNLKHRGLQVLVAAAASHAQDHFLDSFKEVKAIAVTLLDGGRSGDSVAVVRINNRGKPILAKIGDPACLVSEAQRFRDFMQEKQDYTPRLYIHRDAALLTYPLHSADFETFRPAPTLEACIQDMWLRECGFGQSEATLSESEFASVVSHAIKRLASLCRQHPELGKYASQMPNIMAPVEKTEQFGINWGFEIDVIEARRKAEEIAGTRGAAAIIHGDIHLRNILVTSTATSELIDFAGLGPGHPATDLVRLEIYLFASGLRQLTGEDTLVSFQKALTCRQIGFQQLAEEFPTLVSSATNRACIKASIAARDAALQAVVDHGGKSDDYAAVKLLTAWQMLTMTELNQGALRATILAISNVFV